MTFPEKKEEKKDTLREAAKRPTATPEEMEKVLESTGCVPNVTTVSCFLQTSGLRVRTVRQKPFCSQRKHPALAKIL